MSDKLDKTITAPHPHDVISGRGNETIAYAHPGNVQFRNLVKCFKLQYVASKKSDKPAFAKAIVMTITKKNPPGRFLKQDKSTGLWHDIGYKQALAKTRQALREGAPLIGKQMQRHKQQSTRLEAEHHQHIQNNVGGAVNTPMQEQQTSLGSTNAIIPTVADSTLVDLLREKQRALTLGHPQGVNLQNAQGQYNPFLVDKNRITPASLHPSLAINSNPMAFSHSNRPIDHEASAILSSNTNALLAHNAHSGAMFAPVRLDNNQKFTTEALSNQQAAMSQCSSLLGHGLSNGITYEHQALVQARQTTRREDLIVGALYSSQQRVVELLRQRQREQQQQQLRQLEEMQRHAPLRQDDPGNTQEEDAMGGLLLLKDVRNNQTQANR